MGQKFSKAKSSKANSSLEVVLPQKDVSSKRALTLDEILKILSVHVPELPKHIKILIAELSFERLFCLEFEFEFIAFCFSNSKIHSFDKINHRFKNFNIRFEKSFSWFLWMLVTKFIIRIF